MLIAILLSVLLALCSTIFVHPWFWRSLIKRKTLIGDKGNRGFSEKVNNKKGIRNELIGQFVMFIIVLVISLASYFLANTRINISGSILPIETLIICKLITVLRGWNDYRDQKFWIGIGIMVVLIIFPIRDGLLPYIPESQANYIQSKGEIITTEIKEAPKAKFSEYDVKALFRSDFVDSFTYSDDKFIYVLRGGFCGNGVVVVKNDSPDNATFIPVNYRGDILTWKVRSIYTQEEILAAGVYVDDNNNCYGKYLILDRPHFFGNPVIKKYVLMNLQNGKTEGYTKEPFPTFCE